MSSTDHGATVPDKLVTPLLPDAETGADPHLWLEDIDGEAALDFVRERNARAEDALAGTERFARMREDVLAVLDSDDRIPVPVWRGGLLYNFWTDGQHERGVWRRTTLESYRSDEPRWEELLDLDALNAEEGASWVWKGARVLAPSHSRALVSLSPGGGDATVVREFDLATREFVADGFRLPLSKGEVLWGDTTGTSVLVARDAGEGSMTTSGYPRTVRRWSRGSALSDAPTLVEGAVDDVAIGAHFDPTPGFERTVVQRATSFYTSQTFLEAGDGRFEQLVVPESAEVDMHREWLTVLLRQAWELPHQTFAEGTLLCIRLDDFRRGSRDFATLFDPTETSSLVDATWTLSHLVLTVLDDVRHRIDVLTPPHADAEGPATATPAGAPAGPLSPATTAEPSGAAAVPTPTPATSGEPAPADAAPRAARAWRRRPIDLALLRPGASSDAGVTESEATEGTAAGAADAPQDEFLTVSVSPVAPREDNRIWVTVTGYLTPPSLSLVDLDGTGTISSLEVLKQAPSYFDASGMRVTRHFVLSEDGTRVPYFQIGPARAGERRSADEPHPTLLYGYGGFEVSLLPTYLGGVGNAWLERGGVYVVANIRGGYEYGPRWHRAALGRHRHRAYEDFAAVAQNLVDRGVTTPEHLGAQGGSNGGLLMGNMMTGYPRLFGAVVCQVPLLDMKRYSHLLAGASWMAEYGDPDVPADWVHVREFSPYHRLRPETPTPPTLITTSTRDDRVHPGHARKMAALMESLGKDVLFYENIEGGHGGAASNAQRATMNALAFEFLWQRLG